MNVVTDADLEPRSYGPNAFGDDLQPQSMREVHHGGALKLRDLG